MISEIMLCRSHTRSESLTHGIVDVLLRRDGHIPELLTAGGVDTIVDVLAASRLAVNDVVERVPLNVDNFGGRPGLSSASVWLSS